jgi:hypothetical protein
MFDYRLLKQNFGVKVSQTIDSPIMIFDHFELTDAFVTIGIVLVFGVIFYAWGIMMFLLLLFLGVGPVIRNKNPKGIFLHWPYRHMGVSLPGLINPIMKRRFSD